MDKLILADIRETSKTRGTATILYPDVAEAVKALCQRSGMTITVVTNKILRYALPFVEVEGESEDKKE